MLLFTYGFVNFLTILLSLLNVYTMAIDRFASWWRILLWEPYWMVVGTISINKKEIEKNYGFWEEISTNNVDHRR